MKKLWLIIGTVILAAAFAAGFIFLRRGATTPVQLPTRYLDQVTTLTLRYPNSVDETGRAEQPEAQGGACGEKDSFLRIKWQRRFSGASAFLSEKRTFRTPPRPDDASPARSASASTLNEDLLHILNLWEIDEILPDSQAKTLLATHKPITIKAKVKNKTIYKKHILRDHGNIYLIDHRALYKMRSPYLAQTWRNHFDPTHQTRRPRPILDLNYYEIQSLTLTLHTPQSTFTLVNDNTPETQAHLTAFKQVYATPIPDTTPLSPPTHTLIIQTTHHQTITLTIHPIPDNPFQAHITLHTIEDLPARSASAPTLYPIPYTLYLIPYVTLDKMISFAKPLTNP